MSVNSKVIVPLGSSPAGITASLSAAPRQVHRIGTADDTQHLDRSCDGSLGAMFDHVGIAFSDLAASERFYRTVLSVLGAEPSHADAEIVEWEDWDIMPTDREHPVTRGLHVGFRAPSRAAVQAFWQAVDTGYHRRTRAADAVRTTTTTAGSCSTRTATAPRPCTATVRAPCPTAASTTCGSRVADLAASKRFYTTIAPHAGIRLGDDEPGRVQFTGEDCSFSLIDDERPLTQHVHIAFPAATNETVDAFHRAAIDAGYTDNGAPGERAVYHPGYYGAFVLDPDRPQHRGRQPQPLRLGAQPN